jgi:cytoskeletal protein CcmA (bactofilin family)
MKLWKSLPLVICAALAVLVVSCQQGGFNTTNREMKTVILPAGEVHEGWYFAAGDHVIIDGTVNGDVYAGAGKVDINGTINGDVLAGGGMVDVAGHVSDDVRCTGGTIRISGNVGKNVTAAGGTIEVTRSAVISGGLLAAGGTIQSAGTVRKDAMVASGTAEFSGVVEGNLDVATGQLAVLHGARIGGNLTAALDVKEHARIDSGTVKGSVTIKLREEKEVHHILGLCPWRFWLKILWMGGLLLTGLVFFLLARKTFAEYSYVVKQNFGMSLVWGLVGLIAVPIAAIILCITVIGIPLGLILLAAYCTVAYLSQLSLGLLAGNLFFKTDQKQGWILYWAFAVGTILFQLLTFVPILGSLLILASLLLGFGALIQMLWKSMRSRPAAM